MANAEAVMATENVSVESEVVLKRPEKLTKIRRVVAAPPYDRMGRPLRDDILSIYEINTTYSFSEVINAIFNADSFEASVSDHENKRFKNILLELYNCQDRSYIMKTREDMVVATQSQDINKFLPRSKIMVQAAFNINALCMQDVDPEFIAIYLESLRLRNINLPLDTTYLTETVSGNRDISEILKSPSSNLCVRDYCIRHNINTEEFKFSHNEQLVLPDLSIKKEIPYMTASSILMNNFTDDYPSPIYTQSIVNTIGKGLTQTGNAIAAIGNNIAAMGKKVEHRAEAMTVVNNYYVTNNALAMLNSADTMTQTNGNSGITVNKLHSELPETMGESVNILKKQFFRFAPALAGLSLAVAVLYGNSTFHEMQVTNTTPAIIKVMHSVNEAIYKKIPHFEPSVEVSTTGEIKGTLKMEPRSEPKVDNGTVVLDKGTQIQKDFYQAITRFDSNDSESIKQLDTLSVTVETILNAQKALGYRDLIVPDDILLKAKQKLSEVHSVVPNGISVVQ